MHYIPYNSRISYHKTPFGAVEAGTKVTLRIILPRDMHCTGVRLVCQNDDGERASISMQWERMEGQGEEWWSVEYTPAQIGVYWYNFEYDAQWGRGQINNVGNSIGSITSEGGPWQLTVYRAESRTPEKIKGGIIYQIFPDRFYNSGTRKKNVPDDRLIREDWGAEPMWEPDDQGKIHKYDYFGGDLKGIEMKLDYLKELGVSCIYLNPIFEAHSNHRYDTADYTKIDPLLGEEKDFSSLCEAAKEKGISIVLDGVFSHTGKDSVYFNGCSRYESEGAYQSQKSPYYKWYKFKKWPDDYVSWWGIEILPEINKAEPSFLEYITGENGVLRRWLKAGASGWRLDVADELTDEFLYAINKAVKTREDEAYILGEVWEDATNKFGYGKRRKYLLGNQLDSVMNYPFANAIIRFLRTGKVDGFMETVMSVMENYPPQAIATLMNHVGTHDTARAITRLAGDNYEYSDRRKYCGKKLTKVQRDFGLKLMKMASAIQFTLPGVPCVYYGDEVGLEGNVDPFNRGCYPWGNENIQLLSWYKELGRIRREYSVFEQGELVPISSVSGCIAYVREDENLRIMLVANRNTQEIVYNLPQQYSNGQCLLGGEMQSGNCVKVGACCAALVLISKNAGT